MGYDVRQILSPIVIRKAISQLAVPGTVLSQEFGWNVTNGPNPGALFSEGNTQEGGVVQPRGNFDDSDIRESSYDIFNHTRKIATGRSPGVESKYRKPQRVGRVPYVIPRAAEKMHLKYERLNNQRKIGGPTTAVDRGGMRYISAQERHLAALFANLIEFQTAAMLRGKYYFIQEDNDPDTLQHSFTDPGGDAITIDYQISADNFAQLDLGTGSDIIDVSWDDPAADIPAHIYAINKAQLERTGYGIEKCLLQSSVWNHILANTNVQKQAGTARSPFEFIRKTGEGKFMVKLHALPWMEFILVDYGLEVYNPATSQDTWQDMIEDNHAVFLPAINQSWTSYLRGGEEVVEGPNGRQSFQYGMYAYSHPTFDPAGINLYCLLNGFPGLYVPNCVVNGTVVF